MENQIYLKYLINSKYKMKIMAILQNQLHNNKKEKMILQAE